MQNSNLNFVKAGLKIFLITAVGTSPFVQYSGNAISAYQIALWKRDAEAELCRVH
jgi:hypothetical protein